MTQAHGGRSLPVLNGIRTQRAQRALEEGLLAAVAGKLTSGHWLGKPEPVDSVPFYRVVIAMPDLYRALEDGLSTWFIGKGPSGQVASCSVPRDAANPNGREAWLGRSTGLVQPSRVLVEYRVGGLGAPNIDGTGTQVYTSTLIGRCSDDIVRVTVRYVDVEEHDAVLAQGVWFDQAIREATGTTGPADPMVRGYDAEDRVVYDSVVAVGKRPVSR